MYTDLIKIYIKVCNINLLIELNIDDWQLYNIRNSHARVSGRFKHRTRTAYYITQLTKHSIIHFVKYHIYLF